MKNQLLNEFEKFSDADKAAPLAKLQEWFPQLVQMKRVEQFVLLLAMVNGASVGWEQDEYDALLEVAKDTRQMTKDEVLKSMFGGKGAT